MDDAIKEIVLRHEMHDPDDSLAPFCWYCGQSWPCDTALLARLLLEKADGKTRTTARA